MFFSEHVDIALIETAMGGRFDTTNCFQPILSIITNIDKDHMGFLGQTMKEIAYHKAGIIKKQAPEIGRHTSELQSRGHLVCRLLLEKKNRYIEKSRNTTNTITYL